VTKAAYSCEKGGRITQLQYFLLLSLRTSKNSVTAKFAEIVKDEIRRIPLPRTPVNKRCRLRRAVLDRVKCNKAKGVWL
jgi:hypothetical protein